MKLEQRCGALKDLRVFDPNPFRPPCGGGERPVLSAPDKGSGRIMTKEARKP
jgi:hypothetical protein